jgi:hypothetical protein
MRMTNMKCRQVSTLLQNTATHMTKGNWNLATNPHVSGRNEKSEESHFIHCQKGLLKRNTKS